MHAVTFDSLALATPILDAIKAAGYTEQIGRAHV